MNIAGQIAESNRFIVATITHAPDENACLPDKRIRRQAADETKIQKRPREGPF
jgi:hypothetical protein